MDASVIHLPAGAELLDPRDRFYAAVDSVLDRLAAEATRQRSASLLIGLGRFITEREQKRDVERRWRRNKRSASAALAEVT